MPFSGLSSPAGVRTGTKQGNGSRERSQYIADKLPFMRKDAFGSFRREITSAYGDNKYNDSEQQEYLNRVINKEIKCVQKQ